MIGIIVTENIKNQNELSNSVGSILTRNNYPNKFWVTERVVGGYANRTDLHHADGWRDVVQPSYNTQTHKRGDIYFDEENDVFTYEVIAKTDAEIQSQLIATSEANKQELIQQQVEVQIVEEAQQGDDTNALDNQDLFPLWEYPFDYTVDYKCQHFTDENELVLYKCVQAHTSQEDWQPKDVPALFTRVAYPNEIPVWVQPTGAQDAYNIGDRVLYPDENGSVYESLIDANVWSPDALPSGWQIIN